MSVPTYDKFIEPILRYLAQHPDGVPARDAHDAAAKALGLSAADIAEVLPSGRQQTYKNRAGWAHDRLKRAGLSESLRRGYWCLTPGGVAYAKANPVISSEQLIELASGHDDVVLQQAASDPAVTTAPPVDPIPARESPDERLDAALAELRLGVVRELLEALAKVHPTQFEFIVLDLLHAMGYGTSREDLQRVGGSEDGGIDGVISLDKLGLEKVYVQAKRWQNAVGRPEIQSFYGALAGQRAQKGVFITTSKFTGQALEFARSVEKVVLVDGQRLAELMIDHAVGVSHRAVRVPKLDSDYFDD
jgi:restriction system protein